MTLEGERDRASIARSIIDSNQFMADDHDTRHPVDLGDRLTG